MRLTHSRKRNNQFELQLTPMIDVVFQLLIFFMVTLGFMQTERELDSAIQVKSQSAEKRRDLEPAIIEVGKAKTGSSMVFRIGGKEFAAAADMFSLLRSLPNKLDGAFVRVSDEAPFEMAAAAIQSAKTAGFVSVTYLPDRATP